MIRWNPYRELVSFDRLFDDVFGTSSELVPEPAFARLPINVEEVDGGYRITAPVPGFKPDQVEVTYHDGVLTINAQRTEPEKTTDKKGYLRRELAFGNLFRQIALGESVKPDGITASFEDGVLTIFAPVVPKSEPTKIPIKGA